MEPWTEYRTALTLAQLGTLSAAAQALDIHRTTVARHIDVLEERLGVRLFLRHARGYALSEAGQAMLETVNQVEDIFTDFARRMAGSKELISGDLIVTAVATLAPLLMPSFQAYRRAHPTSRILMKATPDLADLGYGEAHVAIRAGAKPDNPDYVVLPFERIHFGLYGSPDLMAAYPNVGKDWSAFPFVIAPSYPGQEVLQKWIDQHVSGAQIAFTSNDVQTNLQALKAGLGIGWIAEHDAKQHPELIELIAPMEVMRNPLWFVTHVDMHRTAKVQAYKKILLG